MLSSTGPGGPLDAYQILLRLLHRNDWFTQEKACLLLTEVLASRPDKDALRAPGPASADGASSSAGALPAAVEEVQKAAATFIDWLCAQLRRPSDPSRAVPTAVHAFSRLLREPPLRAMLHRAGGVQLLAPLVAMPAHGSGQLNIQLLYEATLCCWELSFYRPAADVLCGSTNVVGALVDIVRQAQVGWGRYGAARPWWWYCMPRGTGGCCCWRGWMAPHLSPLAITGLPDWLPCPPRHLPLPWCLAQKEKLVRVALMALKNLISVGPTSLEYAVVEKGLPKALSNRALQVGGCRGHGGGGGGGGAGAGAGAG